MNEEINATNDTNNEVARLRWEIKISEEDGIPYLWDNRKYDNYDLGSLCRILNEYEEKTNEVARLRKEIAFREELDAVAQEVWDELKAENAKLRARLNYVQGCDCDNYLHPYCNKLIK